MKELKAIEENLNMVIGALNLIKEKIEYFQETEDKFKLNDIISVINLSQDKLIESGDEIADMLVRQSA